MNAGRLSSLRRKLLAVVLSTTLAALVVALGAMIYYDVRQHRRSWIEDVQTQAELLGRASAPALQFDDPRVADENLGLLRYRTQVQAAAIYDARGALFSRFFRGEGDGSFPALPGADSARVEGRNLVVFQRIVHDGQILGTVYLRADYEVVDRVVGYLGIAAIVAILAMLVAFLLSTRLERIVTGPILDVAEVARGVVETGDYSRRASRLSDDEVGRLAESFNAMLAEVELRTRALERSNEGFAREVVERAAAENEVSRLNEVLEDRVRERTDQLELANRELEAFCYSVSHDLRAPLRAIHGFSQALRSDFPRDLSIDAQHYLDRIQGSAERMAQLIEDLLNLSRVSRSELAPRPVDLTEIAQQVVAALRSAEPGRSVEVSVWDGLVAEGDPRLLRTALENLVGNSWKFTAKTENPRIEVGAMRDGERRVYFVRDNGAGFDMAYAQQLFGAFQRLHRADDFPGTGIGLATVARIVSRHGGRIWAEAQENRGAVFYFTLSREGVDGDAIGAESSQGAQP